MRWKKCDLRNGVNIFDGDDCIFKTTEMLRDDPSRLPYLTLVDGFTGFLSWVPGIDIFVSHAKNGVLYQKDKLRRFDLVGQEKGRFALGNTYICPTEDKKRWILGRIIAYVREADPDCHVRAFGDRIDLELEEVKRYGGTTVRMALPRGRYAENKPCNPHQVPDYTVTNWLEARELPIYGRETIEGRRA